jgi:bifunctional enzyme CysN/CysC/sulfate adenylyltransferase subunit 1
VLVNKMDLVGYSHRVQEVVAGPGSSTRSGVRPSASFPWRAAGDNIATPSVSLPWYDGPTAGCARRPKPKRLRGGAEDARQGDANSPNARRRRIIAGTIEAGAARRRPIVLPSKRTAVATIEFRPAAAEAAAGESTRFTMTEQVCGPKAGKSSRGPRRQAASTLPGEHLLARQVPLLMTRE